MVPAIVDEILRARLVAAIRWRAEAWRDQGFRSPNEARSCRRCAAVLEQLARDVEEAVLSERQGEAPVDQAPGPATPTRTGGGYAWRTKR